MAFGQPNSYGYPSYGYQNQFNTNPIGLSYNQPIVPQQSQQQNQFNQQYIQPSLYGKVVDGIDVVKAMDQPIGSSGIYPKADLSEIFIKGWNSDGTTYIKEYKLIEPKSDNKIENKSFDFEDKLDDIIGNINLINQKIDNIKLGCSNNLNTTSTTNTTSFNTRKKKNGEVVENE